METTRATSMNPHPKIWEVATHNPPSRRIDAYSSYNGISRFTITLWFTALSSKRQALVINLLAATISRNLCFSQAGSVGGWCRAALGKLPALAVATRLSLSYNIVVRSIWSFYAAVSITSLAKRCRGIGEYSATIRIYPSSEKFRWTASHCDTNTACHHRHFLCMSSMFRDTVWKTTTNGVRRSEAENVFDHGVS